jgi:hypothetical protein
VDEALQNHYVSLIRSFSRRPLKPLPVELPSDWEKLVPKKNALVLKGIRAVLFDLYGTLFISGAGEIAAASGRFEKQPGATRELAEMEEYFRQSVQRIHETARAKGNAWPEVRVEEIWAEYTGAIPADWELPQKIISTTRCRIWKVWI